MKIEQKKYNLPDFDLFEISETNSYKVWIPNDIYIILGQSNSIENSLIENNVIADNIAVYKRPSGGQAVVLTPQTIIISVVFITTKFNNPTYYFKLVNEQIIEVLQSFGVENLYQKGISDISINEKKILGSSIYRRKEKLMYHVVLNYSESALTFERYLKHPEKEPDYRKGRQHRDFVTSLMEQGCKVELLELSRIISNKINSILDL